MSILQVQQRTASGLTNVGQFPQSIVGSMGSAIIESGSNANGNYVKFADGTLICTSMVGVNKNSSNSTSMYNYPSTFSTYNSIKVMACEYGLTSESNSGFRAVEIAGYNVTEYRLKLLQAQQGGVITLPDTGTMFMHSIGKW